MSKTSSSASPSASSPAVSSAPLEPTSSGFNARRRHWLYALGLAPLAGAAVAALSSSPLSTPVGAQTTPAAPEASGYHETEHIRKYYRTARLL